MLLHRLKLMPPAARHRLQRWLARHSAYTAVEKICQSALAQCRHDAAQNSAQIRGSKLAQMHALCGAIRQQAAQTDQFNWQELAQHANGYLRFAAFQLMTERPQAAHIPLIIRGLNDWVAQVRLAARVAMRAHLRSAFFPLWLQHWPQVRQLYQCQREIHRHAVLEVEQFLLKKKHHAALCALVQARSRSHSRAEKELRREVLRLVAHANLLPPEELVALALASSDHLIAGCAAAWICDLPADQRIHWIRQGLQAKQAQTRQACFRLLLRQTQTATTQSLILQLAKEMPHSS